MSEMVERVARALCAHFGDEPDAMDVMPDGGPEEQEPAWKAWWEVAARKVIETMREPTEAMIDAGHKFTNSDQCSRDDMAEGFSAMIDEALK